LKTILPLAFLIACTGLVHAAIIETISLDLTQLHAGSRLSGNFILSDAPAAGDTAPVTLSFSDPSNYVPTSLMGTITILSGTPSGFAVDFSPLIFTNLSGTVTPVNTRDVSLTRFAFAVCNSFPCTATGRFQDRSPAVFTADYTVTPAAVPEPGYVLLMPMLLTAILFGGRLLRPATKTAFRQSSI